MENKFILTCESTVDLPYEYVCKRNIPVLFYTYTVDGKEYEDDMGKDPSSLDNFYKLLDEGHLPSTSQINVFKYENFFESVIEKYDGEILHIAFGSGMTPSVNNAYDAAKKVMEKHPGRVIRVVDSLGSCTGYGIKAAMWCGATIDPLGCAVTFNRACCKPDEVAGGDLVDKWFWFGEQPFLKVNLQGKRFCNRRLAGPAVTK